MQPRSRSGVQSLKIILFSYLTATETQYIPFYPAVSAHTLQIIICGAPEAITKNGESEC